MVGHVDPRQRRHPKFRMWQNVLLCCFFFWHFDSFRTVRKFCIAFGTIADPTVATDEFRQQVCGTCVEQPLGGSRSTRLWLNESTIAKDLHGDRWSLGFLVSRFPHEKSAKNRLLWDMVRYDAKKDAMECTNRPRCDAMWCMQCVEHHSGYWNRTYLKWKTLPTISEK